MNVKTLLPLAAISLFFFSCGDNPEAANPSGTSEASLPQPVVEPVNVMQTDVPFLGYYVGSFDALEYKENKAPSYSNRINISVDSLNENMIYGHSVVAGNVRPFEGTYEQTGDIIVAKVTEPGDDKYDGAFEFKLDSEKKIISGTWTANDENLAVTKRKYQLEAKQYVYDANAELTDDVVWTELYNTGASYDFDGYETPTDDVLKFNASKDKLTSSDVENMFKGDLEIIRNTIYARHGYSFKNRKMRYVFDNFVSWYIPVSTNIQSQLTALELENIDLLKRYEKHADKYYDGFGR